MAQCFTKCTRARLLSNKITSEQKIYSTAQCFSKCARARPLSNKIFLICRCRQTSARKCVSFSFFWKIF